MTSVNRVSDSSDERDHSLDEQWAQEAEIHLGAYYRGEVQAIPLNEVMAKYPVKLAWEKYPKKV